MSEPAKVTPAEMEERGLAPLRRFRLAAVRIALLSTAIAAAIAYFWNPVVGQGLLMGSLAGILGFWILAVRIEKLARLQPEKVNFSALTWTGFRFLLYGAVLYKAYTLDTSEMHGLLGALAGIFIIRFVLVFLGITGADLGRKSRVNNG